ncbi:hypothetical protein MRX96_006205 [Rhipicephalus microplus]
MSTNQGAFDPATLLTRQSYQPHWTMASSCTEHSTAAMKVPSPIPTSFSLPGAEAQPVLLQPDCVAATPPATQPMASVTAAVELPSLSSETSRPYRVLLSILMALGSSLQAVCLGPSHPRSIFGHRAFPWHFDNVFLMVNCIINEKIFVRYQKTDCSKQRFRWSRKEQLQFVALQFSRIAPHNNVVRVHSEPRPTKLLRSLEGRNRDQPPSYDCHQRRRRSHVALIGD